MLYPSYNRVGFKSVLESPTSIGQIHEIKVPTQPEEFYVSIHRFDESIAVLPSLSDLPPGTVSYCDFLFIDLDSRTDLGVAYRDALTICSNLEKLNAVYELWYSGGKGFHVAIPTSQFGYAPTADAGILKRMAEGIKGDIKTTKEGGTFDPSIYNQTRIFRYPGTWNKKGGYKTFVKSCWETAHFDLEEVVLFSKERFHLGNDAESYIDLPLNPALVQLYEFCKSAPLKQQVTVVGENMFAPCLEGGRNEQAFTIAHRLFKKGLFKTDVEWILGKWNASNPKPLSPSEVSKVIYSAEKGRIELAPANLDKAFNSIGSLLDAIPEELRSGKKKFRTGYEFFDSYTLGGFEAEELVFIAARSGNFKTAFLCNILQRGSAIAQKPCLLFSMEMGAKTLRPRLIQQAEGITKTEVLDRMAHGDTFGKTREAFQHLDIVHLSNLTTEQMIDLVESYVKKKGSVAAIGIDFLGLFRGCNNDTQKTARQAQELKTVIAKSFDCPVICLAQAKQVYEGREGNVELTRNCVKDSDSVLDLGDYSIGMWKHWITFADATEDNVLFGRFLKSRGLDSEKFKPNPYFALKWKKEVMQLEDIIYCEKAPYRFRQVKEEQG